MVNAPPPVLQDLAPTGRIRAAINFGNPVLAQRSPGSGCAQGISVDLALELGHRLGVPVDFVPFEAAGKVVAAVDEDAWDVAFLASDPERAQKIAFTEPYVILEGTYIVPTESALQDPADFDRAGIRIAVGRGAAYDLYLSRTLEHAELVRAETSAAAVDLFVRDSLDCAAGVRQPLLAYAREHPGFRVIAGSFNAIAQAMCTPRGRAAGLDYLNAYIEEMQASGFVAFALARAG
jgi:polar amino acid transport system substrate-binding protein